MRLLPKRPSSQQVVLTSLLVDVSDVALNLVVAFVSRSVVMLTEALQGGADLITSSLLLVGVARSRRRADRFSRFGYGREIFFWTLMAGIIMLVFTSALSISFGWRRVFSPQPVEHTLWAIAVLVLGLITNTYAFNLSLRRLKNTHPHARLWNIFVYPDLIETKAAFILDLMGALAAGTGLIALIIYLITQNPIYDGVGAIIIGLIIAALSFLLVLDVKDLLVGRSAPPEVENRIRRVVERFNRVQKVLDLRTMYIGSGSLLVNLEVHVAARLKTEEIEQLIDRIKERVRHEVPGVRHIQVELETP